MGPGKKQGILSMVRALLCPVRQALAIFCVVLASLLSGAGVSASKTADAHPAADTCNPGGGAGWYDTWYYNVQGASTKQIMHYNVGSDCYWKAYWEQYYNIGGPPAVYTENSTIYSGYSGSKTYLDDNGTRCASGNPAGTYYFHQYSSVVASIIDYDYWQVGSCSGTVSAYTYLPAHQP